MTTMRLAMVDFAIGEGVERVHHLLRVHAGRALDLDLDVLRREIVDGFDLELALVRRRLRWSAMSESVVVVGGISVMTTVDSSLTLMLGADFHRAFAVLIIARVHQAAGRKIRQALERLLLEDGDLRFEQFGEIVRQNARGQADRDAFRAEHQRAAAVCRAG